MTDTDAPDLPEINLTRDRAIEIAAQFLRLFIAALVPVVTATGFSLTKEALIAAAFAAAATAWDQISGAMLQGGVIRSFVSKAKTGLRHPDALGWGNPGAPGSVKGREYGRANIVTRTSKSGIRLHAHRLAIPLFLAFIDDCNSGDGGRHKPYAVRQVDTGAWNHRYMRALGKTLTKLSAHSWGVALDMNWQSNPQSRRLVTNLPDWVIEIAENRYGFVWGGRFSLPDAMHFQINETPDAVIARVARLGLTPGAAR